ncbi:MAG: hypothetical protein ACI89Z_001219, partial [Porticoccus sp.]
MTTDDVTLATSLGDTLGNETDSDLSAGQIKSYLQAHPSFFENHPDLLELISLPHESGAAVSLVERQVSV